MALALQLGARGLGRTWPNPAVGCVIVRDGRIVGRGWTQPGGRPHAEVEALARAGAAARGATAYVSLEPCAHHGRTPPCVDALVAALEGIEIKTVFGADATMRPDDHQIITQMAVSSFGPVQEGGLDEEGTGWGWHTQAIIPAADITLEPTHCNMERP